MQNFRALGALPPDPVPPAAGGSPPDPHWPPVAGGSAPRQWPISGRVDRASATEAVDSGSIPGRVIRKTIKSGIHSFPA